MSLFSCLLDFQRWMQSASVPGALYRTCTDAAGVRVQPGMQAETPVLLPTSSTEDADVLIEGNGLQKLTDSVGSMALCPDNKVRVTHSDGSNESMSMCMSEAPEQDTQTPQTTKRTARRASVRFSLVETVAPTPATPVEGSPACQTAAWSQLQDAGHTPYSAAVQSHVRFAEETVIAASQHTPAVCSSIGSGGSDAQESGRLQGLNSRNAGSTPAHCEGLSQGTCNESPSSFQGAALLIVCAIRECVVVRIWLSQYYSCVYSR